MKDCSYNFITSVSIRLLGDDILLIDDAVFTIASDDPGPVPELPSPWPESLNCFHHIAEFDHMPGEITHTCAVVAAITSKGGLGMAGRLPWHPRRLSLDMAFLQFISCNGFEISTEKNAVIFKQREANESQNPVIMGRKTWESLPPRFRPLKNRTNLVLTRDSNYSAEGGIVVGTLEEAVATVCSSKRPLFILGGAALYKDAIESGVAECVFLTELVDHPDMPHDVEFPLSCLSKYSQRLNITEMAVEQLKDNIKVDETRRVATVNGEPVFIDGDVTYKIMCYFN